MNLLDEVLSNKNLVKQINHSCNCGCKECKSLKAPHSRNCNCPKCRYKKRGEEKEFLGGLLKTFQRSFRCNIVDLTAVARPKSKSRGDTKNTINHRRTPRNLSRITSVVLHQMAFSRGSDLNRYLRVGSHFIIMPNGKVGQLYPFSTYVNASNTFNSRSVAIEFAGNFPNERGRCWKESKFGCHTLTQQQIDSGRCLLSFLKRELSNMRNVFAHRQSSANRPNDPGPAIWSNIGEWAIKHLGYSGVARTHSENGGKPIPSSWR